MTLFCAKCNLFKVIFQGGISYGVKRESGGLYCSYMTLVMLLKLFHFFISKNKN